MELLLKIDSRGRILIPADIRRKLNLRNVVKVRVEEKRLIIEAVEDPIEALAETVIKGSTDIEKEMSKYRKVVEKEALEKVRERWL
ncbi:MAG: AbrB/MazE/SpoVT family DNA-binding domain-containing protein [Thermoprotei archaeon]|nr:MAG: AbrB/MazE/SpoVT family DNA-binding domain-containing protein [Thermoprotei archaeon]